MALVQKACSEKEKVVSQCFHWGAGFLVIGLLLEPFGGGIKKDHATLSYFLVTPGLGFMMVGSLTSLFDLVRAGRWMRTISQCGANPIFGYLATTNLVGALSALLYYGPFISNRFTDPWTLAFLQGGVMTATVAIVTAAFTRRGWFLRA
jgi:predicted acyltransferase